MTYQQLDAIADSVNPALAVLTLLLPFMLEASKERGRVVFFVGTLASVATLYAVGWLDAAWRLWSRLGLDYSTHSGLACVLILSLVVWNSRLMAAGSATFIAYVGLMLYQQYHTLADVLSTVAVVAPMTFLIHVAAARLRQHHIITSVAPR